MIPESHFKALKIIIDKLSGKNINWVIIGSTNLALQGVDVDVHDIDVLTDKVGSLRVAEALKEHCVTPFSLKEKIPFKSYYGAFRILDVEVEVIAEIQHQLKTGRWSTKSRIKDMILFYYKGLKIPLLPLESELEAYELMGRTEKVNKIKAVLDKKK